VRLAALAALALPFAGTRTDAQTQDHQYSSAEIEAGARLYSSQCASCHGPSGEQVAGVSLRSGRFRRAASDDELRGVISVGVPEAGMLPFKFERAELDALVAFLRAGLDVGGTAVRIGDAARGRALFEGKGACATCHRVNGRGPRVAPDLSDVGATRQAAALQRALVEPSSAMWPIHRAVRAVTRDGRTLRGRRLNEDTFSVQLIDEQERLVSLEKSELREYELARTSSMPPATRTLDAPELADVLAYLLSLKGQP
jgi:putative heme-binding domain-containing protein